MNKYQIFLKRILGLGIILTISSSCISQELFQDRSNRFIDSLSNIYGDSVETKIWDHLIPDYTEYMIGSQLSEYLLVNLQGDTIDIDEIDKPLFFKVTASWCRGCIPEIPALDELASKYSDEMEFIFLTHDRAGRAKSHFLDKLGSNVHVIPSTQFMNVMNIVKLTIGGFDHILPFPTTYITDKNHKIISIEIGGAAVGTIPTKDGGTKEYSKADAHKNTLDRYEPLITNAIEK